MTEQDALDLELGRAVRELAPAEIEIAKARFGDAFRVSYFVTINGVRAWRSVNRPTLDAAVSAARKGARAGGAG